MVSRTESVVDVITNRELLPEWERSKCAYCGAENFVPAGSRQHYIVFLLGKIIEEDNNRMSKIAIVTDSNSGISQKEAKEMGIFVLPMPFLINGKEYLDGVDLLPEQFYEFLKEDADVATSQPSPAFSPGNCGRKVLK